MVVHARVIELREVSKRYGEAWAVRRVSLTVAAGEFLAILGASGSGKTTLLRMMNRLIEPDEGAIAIDGKPTRDQDPVALRRTIGYVIQHVGLLPHLTVADNVAIVPRLLDWAAADIRPRVDELLALIGLPGDTYRDRYPDELMAEPKDDAVRQLVVMARRQGELLLGRAR